MGAYSSSSVRVTGNARTRRPLNCYSDFYLRRFLSMRISIVLATAYFSLAWPMPVWSKSACDLNQSGSVNVVDVQLAVNMYLGTSSCTATLVGSRVCNQHVVN